MNSIISERDVRFSDSQLAKIGSPYGFWDRLTGMRRGTPAMILLEAPEPLASWRKSEGDLCYVVMERRHQGFLVSFNRTNWMRWMLLPDAAMKNMTLDRETNTLHLETDKGVWKLEIIYGQVDKVEEVLGASLNV